MKKPKSLRGSVILLVALCWALPLLILSVTGGWYVLAARKEDVSRNAEQENRLHAERAVLMLDEAITHSRNLSKISVSVHGVLYDIWKLGDSEDRMVARYMGANALLNSQLGYNVTGNNPSYEMAGVVFFDSPEVCYRLTNRDWEGAADFPETLKSLVADSLDEDGRIRFYIDGEYVYLMRNLLDRKDFAPFGTVIFCLEAERIMGGFLQTGQEPRSVGYWLNGVYGHIGDEGAVPDIGLRPVSMGQEPDEVIYFDGLSLVSYGISTASEDVAAKIVLRWNSQPLWQNIQIISVVYLGMILSSIAILVGALRFFARHVTRPLGVLRDMSKRLEAGALGIQAEPFELNRDFSQIVGAFNSMSAELKKMFDRIYDEELALKDAKIMALRSQINPHFLYNTLELMNWQALLGGQQGISEMIGALSVLLDASLNRSDTREVPLREELGYADAFIFILSKRYGDRLTIKKSIEQKLLNTTVPPLVIQPLLENAVQHGYEKTREREIVLTVRQEGERICIEVANSGALDEADRVKIQMLLSGTGEKRGAHLGIQNIRERLRLLYGGAETFDITSEGGFTSARITLPLKKVVFAQGEQDEPKNNR
jgi:two-component system sensor histidine kinase YesM